MNCEKDQGSTQNGHFIKNLDLRNTGDVIVLFKFDFIIRKKIIFETLPHHDHESLFTKSTLTTLKKTFKTF